MGLCYHGNVYASLREANPPVQNGMDQITTIGAEAGTRS
ncbi:hypothetical protein HNQ75_002971 [Rhizobium flavum]|uniref:Uncharacterized protein n=1 Tax=Pseudorhizobium flavum TaxID=1335061 RepID=A0A7W9YZ14_9HYPH|nr:hypothetical protein [Pseudorhizobium flavum]CAD6601805.1 hypothetical protein RFYW14_00966 [Pseudorhizobium flavum]